MFTLDYLRHFRFLGYAIFDLSLAFLGMALVAPLLSKLFLNIGIYIPYKSWILWALPIGIVAHLLIGTITPMTAQFIDPSSHYVLKILIVVLILLGSVGIKKVAN
ncbi:MAG: hypothetical protein Q8Q18_02440 [bacterium]|nr:hypothetical protein [bacterium]